jgi:glycosyltransferase involved in cell wall biosynthesis
MVTPFVSVVIPVYNNRGYVARSIESALAQTHTDLEVIVVDDCSTDGTQDIIKQYESKVQLLFHSHNQGVSVARNNGISVSKGDFIAFLDADDLWEPDKIARFLEAFTEKGKDVLFAFSDFKRFNWHDGLFFALSNSALNPSIFSFIRHQSYKTSKSFRLSKSDFFLLLLSGYPVYPSTMVIRRELLQHIGEWSPHFRRNQDIDFSLRTAKATDCLYIDEQLTNIGRHGGNASADLLSQLAGDIRIIDHHSHDRNYSKEERDLIFFYRAKRLCGLGYHYMAAKAPRKARRCYLQAMRCWPWFGHALVRYLASFVRISQDKVITPPQLDPYLPKSINQST